MTRLKALVLCLILVQLACDTLLTPLKSSQSSDTTPASEVTAQAPVSSPTTPGSFDPHTWGEYKLLNDFWPVINEKLGGSIEVAAQSVSVIDYSSVSGYVAVGGCDQAKINADDLHALPIPGCEDTTSGKAANTYLFILDAKTGEIIATLPPTGMKTTVQSLEFSNDGKVLAYGLSTGKIVVWDIASASIEADIPQPTPEEGWWPHYAAFSPDDRLIAVNYGTSTKIWERATKTFIAEIDNPQWPGPTFSQDGRTLLLEAPPEVIYSTDTWEKLSSIWDSGYPYWAVADINPDLTLYADAEIKLHEELKNGPVRVYDLTTGDLLQTLEGTWNSPGWVRFTPDGRYLLRMDDTGRQLVVWQVEDWKYSDESSILVNMVNPDDHFVQWPLFSSDGRSILLWTFTRIALYGLPQ